MLFTWYSPIIGIQFFKNSGLFEMGKIFKKIIFLNVLIFTIFFIFCINKNVC
jgi:hypothetical protein